MSAIERCHISWLNEEHCPSQVLADGLCFKHLADRMEQLRYKREDDYQELCRLDAEIGRLEAILEV
jgi:hypothetical protein